MDKTTHIINMSLLPNLIYRVNATIIKIQVWFFLWYLKSRPLYGRVRNRHNTLEKNKVVRIALLL